MIFAWIFMDFHGFSWISTDSHGFSWIFTTFRYFSWISTDSHGSPWVSTDSHGFPGKPTGCQSWDSFRDLEIEVELEGGDGVYPPTITTGEFDGSISFFEFRVGTGVIRCPLSETFRVGFGFGFGLIQIQIQLNRFLTQ